MVESIHRIYIAALPVACDTSYTAPAAAGAMGGVQGGGGMAKLA